MAINLDNSFQTTEDGFSQIDNDGLAKFYLTSGTGDPSGSPAPQNTWYLREDTQTLYYKFGALNTDWRQLRANDITALDADFLPSNIQSVLDSLLSGDTPSVSQTLIFGGGGNTSQNSWLTNQGVPSNTVGVPVGLTNPKIRSIFLGNENIKTGNVRVRQRFPAGTGSFTNVYTLALSNQSFANVTGLDVSVTSGAEIGIFTEVSLKNVKVVVNINGDSA